MWGANSVCAEAEVMQHQTFISYSEKKTCQSWQRAQALYGQFQLISALNYRLSGKTKGHWEKK